jgi:MFS family permease
MLRVHGRGLFIAFLLSFGPAVSNSFARFAYALLLPAMRTDLQWNWSQAGAINTVNAFGYLLGALLVRAVVNRAGNRRLFCAGMVITSLALFATGLVRDLPALMALRVLTGIGGAAVFICGGALSGNVMPRGRDGHDDHRGLLRRWRLGLMLTGAVLPGMLDAQGPASWPQAWRDGMRRALMTAARSGRLRIDEPGRGGSSHGGWARWPSSVPMRCSHWATSAT